MHTLEKPPVSRHRDMSTIIMFDTKAMYSLYACQVALGDHSTIETER